MSAATCDGAILALDEEARNLMARVAEIFADVESIRAASSSLNATRLSGELRDVVDEAAVSNLIGRSKPIPASPDLADLLTHHKDMILAAGGSVHLQHRTSRM